MRNMIVYCSSGSQHMHIEGETAAAYGCALPKQWMSASEGGAHVLFCCKVCFSVLSVAIMCHLCTFTVCVCVSACLHIGWGEDIRGGERDPVRVPRFWHTQRRARGLEAQLARKGMGKGMGQNGWLRAPGNRVFDWRLPGHR